LNLLIKKTFTYSEKSESKRKQFLEELKKIPLKQRVYADESGIQQDLIRTPGRAKRGVRVEDIRRGRNFQ
jgi:hypothetical protein